ncbi:hypothetical protein GIB67_037772 [Kingdonia uniflora]|uniref:Glycosyl transferase family 3 N-terminal domain-containing protein n=1 Tax=Kingdonia uniflora TaxID=39325 RepID=A0A7J7LV99_9MAGN|nr:hypothetical protein GIB67_037772 [Kingdonia uniflora]
MAVFGCSAPFCVSPPCVFTLSKRYFEVQKCLLVSPITQRCSTSKKTCLRSGRESLPSPATSFDEIIETLISKVDLSEIEAEDSFDFMLSESNEALISTFLVLLRAKGEIFKEVH